MIGAKKLLLGSWLNILLLCLPLGWISHFVKWSPYATFLLNLISLVPLALMLGEITEDLALRFGDTIGEQPHSFVGRSHSPPGSCLDPPDFYWSTASNVKLA